LPSSRKIIGRVGSAYVELTMEGKYLIALKRRVGHCPTGSDLRENKNCFGSQVVVKRRDE
jgi:hypothetical protein